MNTVEHDQERHHMWCSFIPNYRILSRQQKRKAKMMFANACGYDRPQYVGWLAQIEEKEKMVGFDLESNTHFIDVPGWVVQKKFVTSTKVNAPNKKEETMNTETFEQRNYLENRLSNVYNRKMVENRNHFHMDPDYPATLREGLERIAKGTVKFPTVEQLESQGYSMDGRFCENHIWNSLDWRTIEADKDGFKAAEKLLGKAYIDAKDQIKVLPLDKGLEALKAFESATFH